MRKITLMLVLALSLSTTGCAFFTRGGDREAPQIDTDTAPAAEH